MDTGIKIGNDINANEAVGPLADAIVRVLEAISETGADRETSIKALSLLEMACGNNVTLQHCTVKGN